MTKFPHTALYSTFDTDCCKRIGLQHQTLW